MEVKTVQCLLLCTFNDIRVIKILTKESWFYFMLYSVRMYCNHIGKGSGVCCTEQYRTVQLIQ
eukprot:m.233676 g.233676  ORF g.233676 m.233676 type:complete len:63 (+) comp13909_c2_seq1:15705-15893(+)